MAGEPADMSLLSSVLTTDELASVSETVQQKLGGLLEVKDTALDRLKSQLDRERGNSEQCYFELEKHLVATNTKVEKETEKNQELTSRNAKLEEKLKASEAKLQDIKENREDNSAQTQQLTRVNKQLDAEKQDLLSVLTRKDHEIKRLNEEWQSMSEKLSVATTSKCEIQVKLDEIQSQDVSVKYREKRLEQEKQLLTSQNEWLSTELQNKTTELLSVRKEKSNQIVELQGQLNNKTDEAKHLQDTVDTVKKAQEDQNARIERLVKKIQENHESMAKTDEQFQSEIQAQSKLANLYKTSAEEAESRVKELITAVEELQKLLKQATEAQGELEEKVQKMETEHGHIQHDLNEKISKLEKELEDANDLITAARRKGVAPISEEELTALSPTAAAASSFLKSGMTLTQIYSEYVKASDELQLEQQENQRLNHYLDQILQEIEEKAPIMQKQREDYEKSLETNNQLSIRLDSVLLECEQLRVTSDESDRKCNHLAREHQRLKQQSADLGQQVRVLLNEVQEARGGPIGLERDDVSSSDISSSSHIISEHLVTFRSIEELQKQNEKLLASIRDLSEKQEQQEKETVETKTSELRQQLESALEDLDQMRTARARQTEMVESIVRQRDMYRVLLEQSGSAPPHVHVAASTSPLLSPAKQTTPVSVGIQRSPNIAPADSTLEDTKMAIKTLQTEYDTYKKEKEENARMLNEQIEKLQKELSDFRVQNAKLASQLDFSGERFKTLQSNVEGYKKEIAAMRDKSQKVSSEIIQHQQTISALTQDLSAAQERCTKAEVSAENRRAERDLLKGVEVRLNQEKESLLREQRGQSLLLTNLQTIQNNLERSEFETKARLTNQLEVMERELTVLRRRLEGDNDQHRTILKSWEGKVQELQRQLNYELDNHQKTREDLHKCKHDLQNMKQQCSGVEAQLVAAQIKLESAVREKNEAVTAGTKRTVVSSAGHEEEIRELRVTIRRKDDEIKGLNDQIVKSKQHTEQYKSISGAIEESLKEQNAASQTFKESMEKRLQEAIQAKEQLEKQVRELEKERDELKNESTQLNRAVGSQTAELRRTVSRLQDELKEAIDRKSECEAMEAAARQDSQEQARISTEAQDKFEREFLLHAADVKQLVTVKEQLSSHNTKLAQAEDKAKQAQDSLTTSKTSWEEQIRIQKQEVVNLTKRCQELDEQNKVLHEQLQSLSKRMIDEQTRKQDQPDDEGVLPSEKSKSADQLLEVIKFLRREKDIAESRFEVAQSENIRLQQKSEHIEKQLDEAQQNLSGERERAQVLMQTSAQHQDLMKKVETLNVLSDSNRLQREEKERLQLQVHQMESKINQLEGDIMPLQAQNRDLTAQRDALVAEKASLAYDVNRWKQRTDHLMQQYNRADPEEQKKLLAEKESNRKTINSLNEENLRHKAEISRLNAQLSNARTEISKLNNSLQSAQSQMKMEQNKLREQLNTLKQEITTKDKDVEEKTKTINQVKKIGRRYKSQFEETKTKMEELEKQFASQKAAPPQPDPATVAKVAELEQKVQALTQETENFKKAEAELKSQISEKEKKETKSNTVLQGAKQKITQLIAERDKQQSEADELRGEVSAMESIMSSKETQLGNQKKESDARIAALEKQLQEARSKQAKQQENQTEQQQKQQDQNEEMNQLRTKLQEQQKQIEELQKQLSQQNIQPIGADRPSTSREEPPPTANIKPTAVSKPSPHATGARMTASIRPIPVTPTSTTSVVMATTPTATVMPQTSSTSSDQDTGEQGQAQSEAPILSIAVGTPIQAVPPTQQTPPMAMAEPIIETESEQGSGSRVEELGQVVDPPVTESDTSSTSTLPSQQQQQPQTLSSEPTPVVPVEPASVTASKRPRDDTSDGDGSSAEREEKRQRVTPQPPPIDAAKEQESLQQSSMVSQEAEQISTEQTPSNVEPQEVAAVNQAPVEVPSSQVEEESTEVQDEESTVGQPSSQVEDDVVIVIGSEDEAGGGAEEGDDEDEGDDDEEEEEVEEEEEYSQGGTMFEDAEGYPTGQEEYEEGEEDEDMDDEGEEEGDEDEEEEEPEEEEEMEGEEEAEGADQAMEEEEEEDSDDVVVIDSDDDQPDDQQMDTQHTEQERTSQPVPEQQVRRVAPPQLRVDPPEQVQQPSQEAPVQVPTMARMGRTRDRLPSLGRTPFSLSSGVGAVPFEDIGDHDCQVPSTPTLFVPPRTDGFAEAINSPLVQRGGQFQFGTEADRSRGSGLAQLATQGDLGMDDTRINLLGGDEEGGRSVPTTPLQTQAPVTMLSSSPSAPSPGDASQSVPVTSVSTTESTQASDGAGGLDEPDTLPSEVPQTKAEQGETTEQERSSTVPSSQASHETDPSASTQEGGAQDIPGGEAGTSGMSRAAGETGGEDTAGTSGEPGGSESKQKPIKRIVWGDKTPQGEQQRQVPPQSRGPPAGHPQRGGLPSRGGGQFSQRGGPQGHRGGGGRGRFIQRNYHPRGRARGGMNFARRGGQGY